MSNPKIITIYRSGFMGAEISTISTDTFDYSPKSKVGKQLYNLIYKEKRYKAIAYGSHFDKYELKHE